MPLSDGANATSSRSVRTYAPKDARSLRGGFRDNSSSGFSADRNHRLGVLSGPLVGEIALDLEQSSQSRGRRIFGYGPRCLGAPGADRYRPRDATPPGCARPDPLDEVIVSNVIELGPSKRRRSDVRPTSKFIAAIQSEVELALWQQVMSELRALEDRMRIHSATLQLLPESPDKHCAATGLAVALEGIKIELDACLAHVKALQHSPD
jgi:hypothetical protein